MTPEPGPKSMSVCLPATTVSLLLGMRHSPDETLDAVVSRLAHLHRVPADASTEGTRGICA